MNDAVRKAAIEAAAKELYKERCRSVGTRPLAWGKVSAKVKKGLREEAAAELDAQAPQAPPPGVSHAPVTPTAAPPPDDSEPPPVLGGEARVRGDGATATADEYKPQHDLVVLKVKRKGAPGVVPFPINADMLAPDATSIVPAIVAQAVAAFTQAQQQPGYGGEPVVPQGEYALRSLDGKKTWADYERIEYGDFTEKADTEAGERPALTVLLVDSQGTARVASPRRPAQQQNVGLGNPYVIGSTDFGGTGEVLGRPVVTPGSGQDTARVGAGQGQVSPASDGAARV